MRIAGGGVGLIPWGWVHLYKPLAAAEEADR